MGLGNCLNLLEKLLLHIFISRFPQLIKRYFIVSIFAKFVSKMFIFDEVLNNQSFLDLLDPE